jgi:uncharacterized protein
MSAQFMWFDVTAADTEVTADFYAKLFGWTTGPAENAEPYRTWLVDDGRPWAGVVPSATGSWLPYVAVDDLDAATERATALGGTVVRDRVEGPAGTSVVIADPGGARVALFVPRATA